MSSDEKWRYSLWIHFYFSLVSKRRTILKQQNQLFYFILSYFRPSGCVPFSPKMLLQNYLNLHILLENRQKDTGFWNLEYHLGNVPTTSEQLPEGVPSVEGITRPKCHPFKIFWHFPYIPHTFSAETAHFPLKARLVSTGTSGMIVALGCYFDMESVPCWVPHRGNRHNR